MLKNTSTSLSPSLPALQQLTNLMHIFTFDSHYIQGINCCCRTKRRRPTSTRRPWKQKSFSFLVTVHIRSRTSELLRFWAAAPVQKKGAGGENQDRINRAARPLTTSSLVNRYLGTASSDVTTRLQGSVHSCSLDSIQHPSCESTCIGTTTRDDTEETQQVPSLFKDSLERSIAFLAFALQPQNISF